MKIDFSDIDYMLTDRKIVWGTGAGRVAPECYKILALSPEIGLLFTWKHNYGRTGLSPFALHALTKSKIPIREYYEILSNDLYIMSDYCLTTQLPIEKICFWRNLSGNRLLRIEPWKKFYGSRNQGPDWATRERFAEIAPRYEASNNKSRFAQEVGKGARLTNAQWGHLSRVAQMYETPTFNWDEENRRWI